MTPHHPSALLIDKTTDRQRATTLAAKLGLPIIDSVGNSGLFLHLTKEFLELLYYEQYPAKPLRIHVDFAAGTTGYRIELLKNELLLRAVKLRKKVPDVIIDATGGLGRDAFLLAAGGSLVHVCERNPYTAELLRDGLERAAGHHTTKAISKRVILHVLDSVEFLKQQDCTDSVIYLDPMFPPRSKSAMVKQELRLLQFLEGRSCEEADLIQAAWQAAPQKIVVKRPAKGRLLFNIPPSYSIRGKAVRFDIYIPASLPTPRFETLK